MGDHLNLGKEGEKIAEDWLVSKGFSLLYRNWRFRKFEIDIIALKNGLLHFIEVKLRSSNSFGFPEDKVTPKKLRSLFQAVDQFMLLHPSYQDFRMDILSISGTRKPEIFFIEDVYL